jgi:hypothetical protein
MIEHNARLHHDSAAFGIQRADAPEILAVVDHQRGAGGLAALAGAAAARQHWHLQVARDVERCRNVPLALRHQHADRHDLVDRGVRRVAAARRRVEQRLAFGLGAQAIRQLLAHLVG